MGEGRVFGRMAREAKIFAESWNRAGGRAVSGGDGTVRGTFGEACPARTRSATEPGQSWMARGEMAAHVAPALWRERSLVEDEVVVR